ncbi:MAG: alcohol dehydrogenase catalytic domain-containing protein [Pirellulales bacterium]|nr:alcohol dehydrogenase catalytic domain-containing protein [Pirellulales bacterium]
MKALLLTAPKRLEYVDFPDPAVGPDDVLVRVAACGICGSDVHGYDGSTGRRQPPLVMGHEAAGVVAAVGPAVSRFAPGDRVTFDSTVFCGSCEPCRGGAINLCDRRQVLGVSCGDYRRHGAMAQYVVVPERIVHRLPEGFSFAAAALIEAVAVAVHAVGRQPFPPGGVAVVVGAGMIGSLVIQALRAVGAATVAAVDLDERKLAFARTLGADVTLNPQTVDAAAAMRELTAGQGADAAFEVVGASAPLQTAIECVRKGGAVTLVGNLASTAELPLQGVVTRELTLYGSCASRGEYPRAIELMAAGRIDVVPLISACAPLAAGADWFDRLYAREPGLMKVVLEP